jgi:micrococcal nuclease
MRRDILSCLFLIFLAAIAGCDGATRSPIVSAKTIASTETITVEGGGATPEYACIPSTARRESALVTRVTDGDSIEVDVNGVAFRVRYIGMDTPEMNDEPLAEEARLKNIELVAGKSIWMIRDLSEADRYGRLLRYVIADGIFVNRELVLLGLARAGYFPPDLACLTDLRAAEKEAKAARRGMWGLLGSPTYATRVGEGCPEGCLTPPAECKIKGNINSNGEKIYHIPGDKYYEQTVIEPELGERWFCNEAEAIAAGWRRSKV